MRDWVRLLVDYDIGQRWSVVNAKLNFWLYDRRDFLV